MKKTLLSLALLLCALGSTTASPVDVMIGSRGYGMGGANAAARQPGSPQRG